MNEKLKEQLKKDYIKLYNIVKNYKGTLKDLCDELGGHNFEENDYFDLNYGVMCITIRFKDNNFKLDTNDIEIWEDTELIEQFYDISESDLRDWEKEGLI